jgi:hypothetical protein
MEDPMIDPATVRSALEHLALRHSQASDGAFVVPIYTFGSIVLAVMSIDCGGRFLEIRSVGLPCSKDGRRGHRMLCRVADSINRQYRAVKAALEPRDGELVVCVDHWFRESWATPDEVAFLFGLFVHAVREALGAIMVYSVPQPEL